MDYTYQVSVIVASYNPEYEKLRKTIISILMQHNIKIEIIVTDDGSKNEYFDEIKEVFQQYNFENYKLLKSKYNQGTCKNIEKSLKDVNGKYIKLISPGDYLFNECTLEYWYRFMENNKLQVSFGKGIYYQDKNNRLQVISRKSDPNNRSFYELDRINLINAKIAYLILGDGILGAALMVETNIFVKYLEMIVSTVKYLEDGIFRIMLLDGVELVFYPQNVIWYEYGSGVSTSKSTKWEQAIRKDSDEIVKIVEKRKYEKDAFVKKYIEYHKKIYKSKLQREITRICMFPGYFFIKLIDMIKTNKTELVSDLSYIENL